MTARGQEKSVEEREVWLEAERRTREIVAQEASILARETATREAKNGKSVVDMLPLELGIEDMHTIPDIDSQAYLFWTIYRAAFEAYYHALWPGRFKEVVERIREQKKKVGAEQV